MTNSEDFINKMNYYFSDGTLEMDTLSDYDLEYFRDAIIKINSSPNLRIIAVNRGKFNTLWSEPYMILAFNKEGWLTYLEKFYDEVSRVEDTEITVKNQFMYAVIIKYIKPYKFRRSKNKDTRIWLNSMFSIINKYYNTNIGLLRIN